MIQYNENELRLDIDVPEADIVIVNNEVFSLTNGKISLSNIGNNLHVVAAKTLEVTDFTDVISTNTEEIAQ